MVRLNRFYVETPTGLVTHEGAPAKRLTPIQQLRRVVLANLLWEDQFYIDGVSSADLVREAVRGVTGQEAANTAIYAREEGKLRHVPLLIVREMARNAAQKQFVSKTLARIIQRPDELAEFLMIYDGNYSRASGKDPEPLSAQVKKGLAAAFAKFSEYQLAKYDQKSANVRLKDVLFLSHAKPKDGVKGFNRKRRAAIKAGTAEGPARVLGEGSRLWTKIVHDELETPDTWEVNLSEGKDKAETFTRLIKEEKLGALALLRNLRNMSEAGMDKAFVGQALSMMNVDRVLPFRFISAARAVPMWEDIIEPAMLRAMVGQEKADGMTAFLIDVSGSMDSAISSKSQVIRMDAAAGLAILARETFREGYFIPFSDEPKPIPPRRGFALRDSIVHSMAHSGTDTAKAIKFANGITPHYDRIIVITDEQTHTSYPDPLPGSKAYVVNVGAYQNGVGYGRWTHIDGFSEATLKFILETEKESV